MNKELEKIENTYWKISKIVAVIFTLINYQIWTTLYSLETLIKGGLLIASVVIGVFIAINLVDLVVGMIIGSIKHICRRIKDRRLLKKFLIS